VLQAALVVGLFHLFKYLPVFGPCVLVARLIAIPAFGLVTFSSVFPVRGKSQIEAQTEADCGAPSVLIAYGEQDSEIPHMLACSACCETEKEFQ
jgi:hypothetical protein